MKIIIDDKIPFIRGVLEPHAEVDYLPGSLINRNSVRDADALIIRTRTRCDQELLGGSAVRFIATATIGYDHIDTVFCKNAGIRWINAPGCNSSSVEQYMVSAILYLAVKNNYSLEKMTVGIVGVGNVGSKVNRALSALGMKVLLNDPPRSQKEGPEGFTGLDELLGRSDVVSLHVPLTGTGPYRTRGLAGEAFYHRMKKGAVFINTSRGEVVDESALKEAIRRDLLSDVVLDVYENEPRVDRELLSMISLATPHIAGYSTDGKANGTMMSVKGLSRFFGLALDDWTPGDLPVPEGGSELFADGAEARPLGLIPEVYNATYDIRSDHERFMADTARFEQLRGGYPVRREPPAFRVRVFGDDGYYTRILEGLGFNLVGDSCF